MRADAVVFEKPSALQTKYVRPLYIRAVIEGRPVGQVMINGGATVNIMLTLLYKKLGKSKDELKPTDTTMTNFARSDQQTRGVLTTKLAVGFKALQIVFFLVDANSPIICC